MLTDYINNKFEDTSKGKVAQNDKNQDSTVTKRKVDKTGANSVKDKKDNAHSCGDHDHHKTHSEKIKEYVGKSEESPAFLKYNKFVHTGYRINFNNKRKVIKSLFMMHNESVNIWTHLGGAIILIGLVIFLSFSIHSFDTNTLNNFVKEEVKTLFGPAMSHLPNFTKLEHDIADKVIHTAEDVYNFGEHTIVSLEQTLHSISEEIEHVAENIHPETIGALLSKIKAKLEGFAHTTKALSSSDKLADEKVKIKSLANALEKKLHSLQDKLVQKIDSAAFDWIDIYKYIKPTYTQIPNDGYKKVPLSRWPIIVFLLTAVFCLLCSAIYHAFSCISDRANQVLRRLDYAGISILITGSCFPVYVYGFYCQPIYSQIYLSIIGFVSLIVFVVSLMEKIHQPEYGTAKSIMYGALGVFAAVPGIHLVYLNATAAGINDNLDFLPSTPYYLTMGASYLGGLAIYASKFPEKCLPGKFDIWGHSHQIWHLCVLSGIIFTYLGAFDNYYTRIRIPCLGCEV
jgi:adiponectin receptor